MNFHVKHLRDCFLTLTFVIIVFVVVFVDFLCHTFDLKTIPILNEIVLLNFNMSLLFFLRAKIFFHKIVVVEHHMLMMF